MSDLVIFSILSSDIPLDFHDSIQVVSLKCLTYFLASINTKYFGNIPEEKYFTPLKIVSLFIKYFVNHFVDIALTFLIIRLIRFYLMKHLLVYDQSLFY